MAKKITQTQKIRNYAQAHPDMPIGDIAKALKLRYQAVYQVLKVKDEAEKTTVTRQQVEVAKKAAKQWRVLHMSTSNQALKDKVDSMPLTSSRKAEIKRQLDGNVGYWANHIQEDKPVDNVNHPAHYKVGGIETIDFIEAKNLSYHLGNVVKYIARADSKGNREEDLLKARWYLNREIAKFTKE